jgi:hypothetical protein
MIRFFSEKEKPMKRRQLRMFTPILVLTLSIAFSCTCVDARAASEESQDRCEGISLEKAAALLNVPVDDLQQTRSDSMVSPEDIQKKIYKIHPYTCTIRSTSNFLKLISYVTYVYNDPGQARTDYETMKRGYESVSKTEEIPEIGDAAFWAGDKRFQRMVAVQGNVVIDVLSPKDLDAQRQIVLLALEAF